MNAKITTDNLIATSNPNAFVGAIVMWHLSGDVSREALETSWSAQGLDVELLPDLPSPQVCLTRVVEELSKGDVFKRRIKGGGYRLVREEDADKEVAEYGTESTVVLDEKDDLVTTTYKGDDLKETLEASFAEHKKKLSARDISPWLCGKMMGHLKATTLKSNGGTYFVPREKVDEFKRIKGAIEKVCGHRLYMVQAMTTEEAVELVLDAINREAEALAVAVEKDLAQGHGEEEGSDVKPLGTRALESRENRCRDMLDKLRVYEELLDRKLDDTRERIGDVIVAAMEACLAARASANAKASTRQPPEPST